MVTRSTQYEVIEFAVIMAHEFRTPGLAEKLERLMKLARRHGRLMEQECNTGRVSARTVDNLRNKLIALCAEIDPKCQPVCSGDPRGATVKIQVPSGRTNDWGGTGICVPGS